MRRLLILGAVLAGAWFWWEGDNYDFGTVVASTDDELVIRKGDFTMELAKVEDVSLDLRVFTTANTRGVYGIEDADIAPLYLLADTASQNAEVFQKYLCEEKSADQAAFIRLLIHSRPQAKEIESLDFEGGERRCFNVSGTAYYIDRIIHDDEEATERYTNIRSSAPIQPRRMLQLNNFREIACP